MIKNVIWASVFALAAALLQSTLLWRLALYHAVPDLALGILVFTAYSNGAMTGQLTGFFSGLLLDFLSAAPLGLNALVRTVAGALIGLLKGIFILDSVFLPILLCASATCAKALLLFLLHILFGEGVRAYPLLEPTFWIELGLNSLIAPLLFGLLDRFRALLVEKEK